MKMKIVAVAFTVVTVGVFAFTRTKNTPSHPGDLRDAVADYNPDFNKGPDLAEFLKVATDPSLKTYTPFPPIKFAAIKGASINKPGLGSLALRPYVINNTAYRYAQKYPPLLQQTPQNPIAKELLVQWAEIDSTRGLLLETASTLESQDSVLYAEGVQLSKDAAAIKQEQVEFKTAVDAWNQQCVGQPVNEYCTNEYNRLIAWGKKLGEKIDAHNKHVEEWSGRVNALGTSVSSWFDDLKVWEQVILGFIEKAQAFLHDTGTCTQAEWEPLQKAVDDYCNPGPGIERSCKQWNPGNPTLDCSIWREYLGMNLACYDARHNINTTCYGGGNPTHIQAENEASQAVKKCQDLITKYCMKTIESTIPARRYGLGL